MNNAVLLARCAVQMGRIEPLTRKCVDSATRSRLEREVDSNSTPVAVIGDSDYTCAFYEALIKNGVRAEELYLRGTFLATAVAHTFFNHDDLAYLMGGSGAEIFITCFYGRKIPNDITKNYHGKLWNVHASDLPEMRGVSDPVSVMLSQKRDIGCVTVHEVTQDIDAGGVLGQRRYNLMKDKSADKNYRSRVIPNAARLVKGILAAPNRCAVPQDELLGKDYVFTQIPAGVYTVQTRH